MLLVCRPTTPQQIGCSSYQRLQNAPRACISRRMSTDLALLLLKLLLWI